MIVKIEVNGEPVDIPEGLTVGKLLTHLGIDSGRVAVELNREIVRQAAWETEPVLAGARLEIVHFVGGG